MLYVERTYDGDDVGEGSDEEGKQWIHEGRSARERFPLRSFIPPR
jgi:hypothetical protein